MVDPQRTQHKSKGRRKRSRVRTILGILIPLLIFLAGMALLLYPTFSNWWNERHQSRAIASYQEIVEQNGDETNNEALAAAEAYNERLREERGSGRMTLSNLTDEQTQEYNQLLDVTGSGIIGYVRIPKIDVMLPIYHGTDEAVLQVAIGHIEGSSLPVGGKGTHTVISGHRGLPSARLFTDIDSLGEGDVFMITVLDRKITYQVDQILTVLPNETDALAIDPDEDYCTLVTCTPYGINSHRLLVRGHRIANLVDEDVETIEIEIPERELSPQERIQQLLPYILILAAGFFALALMIPSRKRKEDTDEDGIEFIDTERDHSRYYEQEKERRRRQDAAYRRKHYVPEHYYYDDDEDYEPYGYESIESLTADAAKSDQPAATVAPTGVRGAAAPASAARSAMAVRYSRHARHETSRQRLQRRRMSPRYRNRMRIRRRR